jgi:hypothetical protein
MEGHHCSCRDAIQTTVRVRIEPETADGNRCIRIYACFATQRKPRFVAHTLYSAVDVKIDAAAL